MPSVAENKKRLSGRLRIILAAVAFVVLVLVVPPFISVSHFKSQVTQIMSQSLGRPVRLSSVEVRLLPWPGFVLSDLSVAEDPEYGNEPVLHAGKVTASVRLLPLWRGKVEIGKISVDDASLNVVRTAPGRWNLDPLFRTAAAQSGKTAGNEHRLPSLVAKNSRINFKEGAEKLPFSLTDSELSFWREGAGEWRIRLRGHPARTDVSMNQGETGVVRMEATIKAAPSLHQMPVRLDLDWRQAQLGQLARLVTGSDPGWRGDLTGNLHLEGTAEAAQIRMRLRAEGVHRAEFVPAEPLDFDANCAFAYHYEQRSLENLACDSPLGHGHIHIAGDRLNPGAEQHLSVELDRIPAAAGLDVLHALRSGLDPNLEAQGTISGKLAYVAEASADTGAVKPEIPAREHKSKSVPAPPSPLTGSLAISDFLLKGGGLSQPIQVQKIVFDPVAAPAGTPQAIAASLSTPFGGSAPLGFSIRLSRLGYQVTMRGGASIARVREFAHAMGVPEANALASLAGDPIAIDLTAAGPWMPTGAGALKNAPSPAAPLNQTVPAQVVEQNTIPADDTLTGTVSFHNANWKADYLVNAVVLNEATLHFDGSNLRWDPVNFTYGPVKGTATVSRPLVCPAVVPGPSTCPAEFHFHFADLNVASLQTALLGARQKGTLISSLIARIHPSNGPLWPQLQGTVDADTLVLDQVALHKASAQVRILPAGVEITSLDGGLMGGTVHLAGTMSRAATEKDKPSYAFTGAFQKLNVTALGALLGVRWTGEPLSGNGKLDLTGYTSADLAASAKGTLHIECRRGAIGSAKSGQVPAALARFNDFTTDATIANGALQLGKNQLLSGGSKQSVEASVTFDTPPKTNFPEAKSAPTAKR